MYFSSESLSIVFCRQSSTIALLFAPTFITINQPHLLFLNYLNLLSTLIYMQKNSIKINAIDAWNKAQKSLGDTEDLTPNKIKTILMKRTIDSY